MLTPTMFPDSLLDDLPFGDLWPEPERLRAAQPAPSSAPMQPEPRV